MKEILLSLTIIFATLFTTTNTVAQDTILNQYYTYRGTVDSIQSQILNQTRHIQVLLPTSYKAGSTQKYDVLYVLDGGNWNTGLIARTQTFLEAEGYMPPTIIVSVMGIDRNKDLTPTHMESWKTSGGADNFLEYITKELIPYVNKKYPSNGDNTIWGHSLGGMFVMYALCKQPTIFQSYLAVDPSMWWDKCYVAKMVANKLADLPNSNTTLYVSGREGQGMKEMKIDTLDIILKKAAPKNLNWKLTSYSDETHSSVRLKTTYDGLKFTYAGMTSDIQFHPMNGNVVKGKAYKVFYFDDTTKVRYTIDGTIPTLSSSKAVMEVRVDGEAKITYKRFSNRSSHDKSMTGNFKIEKLPGPVVKTKNLKAGGFSYAYFDGSWDIWPDLKGVKPTKTGITDKDFDVDKLPKKKDYALIINGFLKAKEEGYYILLLNGDKNTKLYLGNKLLINWEGNYNRRTYSYMIPLVKGLYPIRVEYLHKNEDFKLEIQYLKPSTIESKSPTPIPVELQYSEK